MPHMQLYLADWDTIFTGKVESLKRLTVSVEQHQKIQIEKKKDALLEHRARRAAAAER